MLFENTPCDFSKALILCGLVWQIIFNYDHVDLSAVRGAGIQCDYVGTIVRAKIRIGSELRAPTLIFAVTVGAMPMATEDRLFLHAGLRCVHPVIPSRMTPALRSGLPPVGVIAVATVALTNAGDPAVDENVVRGLVVVNGCRDNLLIVWRLPRTVTISSKRSS